MLPAKLLVAFLASAPFATAHFLLNTPTSIGFDDDNEGIPPCGGFNVSFDMVSDFHVDGDAVSVRSTHPQANWLFRATLDTTAAGNWTNLEPVINEGGLGAFCEESVKVPAEWAGSRGVMQIVQNAVDGLLYQCAALNFVSGAATSLPSDCTNVTGLTAAFTSDASLSSLPATAAATDTGSMMSMTMSEGSMMTTAATAAASPSTTGSAAVRTAVLGGGMVSAGWLWAGITGLTLGVALSGLWVV